MEKDIYIYIYIHKTEEREEKEREEQEDGKKGKREYGGDRRERKYERRETHTEKKFCVTTSFQILFLAKCSSACQHNSVGGRFHAGGAYYTVHHLEAVLLSLPLVFVIFKFCITYYVT